MFTWSWAALTWDGSWPSAMLHNSDKEKSLGSSAETKQRTKFEREEEAGGDEKGEERGRAAP